MLKRLSDLGIFLVSWTFEFFLVILIIALGLWAVEIFMQIVCLLSGGDM